jgi:hypothetical protein
MPDSLELEVGASALFKGEFGRNAPGASEANNTYFGYLQVRFVL